MELLYMIGLTGYRAYVTSPPPNLCILYGLIDDSHQCSEACSEIRPLLTHIWLDCDADALAAHQVYKGRAAQLPSIPPHHLPVRLSSTLTLCS